MAIIITRSYQSISVTKCRNWAINRTWTSNQVHYLHWHLLVMATCSQLEAYKAIEEWLETEWKMGLVVCCMKMLSFKRVWNVTSYPKRCIVLNPSCTPSLYNSLFTINKLLASSKIQLVRGDFQFVFSKIPSTYDVLYDVLYIT